MVLLSKLRFLTSRAPQIRLLISPSRNSHHDHGPQYSLPPGYSPPAVPHNRAKEIPPRFVEAYTYGTGIEPNPLPAAEEFFSEKHCPESGGKICCIMIFLIIPVASAYVFYNEYQHLIAHPKRLPYPKFEFMHIRTKPLPFGDGEHTVWHHPYWNFTKYGYETDKDGNMLPKGTYVPE